MRNIPYHSIDVAYIILSSQTAKGKGGEEAVRILNDIPGLHVILLTVPFFYSNFLAFFTPLPNKSQTEWEMSACFGDGSTPIDMMNAADLGRIVRKYLCLSACRVAESNDLIFLVHYGHLCTQHTCLNTEKISEAKT